MLTEEKVAFVAHPVDLTIFKSYISSLKPAKQFNDQLLIKLFEWANTYSVKEFRSLSLDGKRFLNAELFMVPFLPEMQTISIKKVIEKIDGALALAKAHGCTIAALGGFTSIVLQNCEENYSRKHGIRITSGNTLTTALIIRSVEQISGRFGVDLSSTAMAIIGASGDIGSACVDYFSRRVKKIYLTARSIPTLQQMALRYRETASAEMEITENNRDAIERSSVCIFVTSAYVALFTEKDFIPGTIVCDASAPPNVIVEKGIRDDVFIYHGGIASVPFPIDVAFDIGLASPDMFYGCQLEGVLLGLHPDLPCSWGRGNITYEKILRFFEMLDCYPSLHPVYSIGNHTYDEERLLAYIRQWSGYRREVV